jgi:sugar phosphate isomerase/epimerase
MMVGGGLRMGGRNEPRKFHPRVAVSGLCFPALSAVESVELLGVLGVTKTSMTSTKLLHSGPAAVLDACREHGVQVVATTGSAPLNLTAGPDIEAQLRRTREDIDRAVAVGARSVYTLTGRRVYADWEDNVDAYANLAGSLVDYAGEKGITLAIEPTNWMYADLSFVHTFHDSVAFALHTGLRVCLDIFHIWTERDLRDDITDHVDLIAHVQLSDMQRGARALPCRAIPGEGDVPIRAVLQWLLDAGYDGPFDLELNGPSIDALGHREAATRSAIWLDALLMELDA